MSAGAPQEDWAAQRLEPGAPGPAGRPYAALLRAMRPRQWIKNLLLFAGFVFTMNETWRPFSPEMWTTLERSAAAFVLFSLLASSVYLFNDVIDAERDRKHPTKRHRPIASGHVAPGLAIAVALVLLPACLTAGYFLSPMFFVIASAYVAMQAAYTFALKEVVLLDVLVIAIGFVMRAVSGAVVIGAAISPWLYTVTLLGALFLALCKRRNELLVLDAAAGDHRKILESYTPQLLDSLISIVASTTIMAYSLYTFTSPNLPPRNLMMLTIPFVIFGMFRYLFLAHSRNVGGSPEEVFLKDRPLILTITLWGLAAGIILSFR